MNVHCNKCFRQKNENLQQQYYVTSCMHIFCAQCVQEKCVICGRNCKWTIISRDMVPTAAILFVQPKKHFQQFQSALRFQLEQEASFCNHTLTQLPPALRKLQKHCEGLQQLDARLRANIEAEKQRIEKLKAYLVYSEQYPFGGAKRSQHSQRTPSIPTLSSCMDSSFQTNKNSSNARDNSENQQNLTLDSVAPTRKSKNFYL